MPRDPRDAADQAAFRRDAFGHIADGNAPSLEVLTDGAGKPHTDRPGFRNEQGEFVPTGKPGVYSMEGEQPGFVELQMDASHTHRAADGTGALALEDSTTNRRDGATLEKEYTLEKKAKEIEGVAMAEHTAERMEGAGMLKPGTVANAPDARGWVRGEGNVGLDGQPLPPPPPAPNPSKMAQEVSGGATPPPPSPTPEKEPTVH